MPTYVCSAATGRLTPTQKTEIVRSITAVHHEETGAPRYLVQVIFHDIAPGNHYVAGLPAPADQIWIRADIRGGRTDEQKRKMLRRMMQDIGRASGAAEDAFGSTCATFPQRISRSTAASCRPPGRRTHGSRRYPMPCGKGSGPWPDKLETLESMSDVVVEPLGFTGTAEPKKGAC
jgi:phenylpyruvate tautomerase PptA (4-oxalocrotonate tautomerase family)